MRNYLQLPKGFSWSENVRLGSPEVYRLSQISWPRFLLEESDRPDPLLKFQLSAQDFKERFKVVGIRHDSSGVLVAFIQAVHVEIDPEVKELSDLGWRFALQDAARRSPKNAISLVEASIDPKFRGNGYGLAKSLIERVKDMARSEKFSLVIAPVRPTLKSQYPRESMAVYCSRKDAEMRILDPWLRTHIEAGAIFNNICHNSVCVKATLEKWREWTGLPLDASGPHCVAGALMPIMVDIEANLGTYTGRVENWRGNVAIPSPVPASSNVACGFPALRFPNNFDSQFM